MNTTRHPVSPCISSIWQLQWRVCMSKKKKAQSVLKPLLRATSAERGHRKSINKYIWTPAGLIMRVDISMHQHDILSLSYYEMCATALKPPNHTHTHSLQRAWYVHCIIVCLQQIGQERHLWKFGGNWCNDGPRSKINRLSCSGESRCHTNQRILKHVHRKQTKR